MKGEYSKLILEEPGPGRELSGLWSGVYGPHGLEVAHVSYTDQEIVATKVLGRLLGRALHLTASLAVCQGGDNL